MDKKAKKELKAESTDRFNILSDAWSSSTLSGFSGFKDYAWYVNPHFGRTFDSRKTGLCSVLCVEKK